MLSPSSPCLEVVAVVVVVRFLDEEVDEVWGRGDRHFGPISDKITRGRRCTGRWHYFVLREAKIARADDEDGWVWTDYMNTINGDTCTAAVFLVHLKWQMAGAR